MVSKVSPPDYNFMLILPIVGQKFTYEITI